MANTGLRKREAEYISYAPKKSEDLKLQTGKMRREVKIIECSVCKKEFLKREHLKRHFRSHTGEKPFVCKFPECEKSFSRSDNLLQHFRSHIVKGYRSRNISSQYLNEKLIELGYLSPSMLSTSHSISSYHSHSSPSNDQPSSPQSSFDNPTSDSYDSDSSISELSSPSSLSSSTSGNEETRLSALTSVIESLRNEIHKSEDDTNNCRKSLQSTEEIWKMESMHHFSSMNIEDLSFYSSFPPKRFKVDENYLSSFKM